MAGAYDNAFKDLVRADPVALCRWLLRPAAELALVVDELPANLPASPLEADGVFRVNGRVLVHVEYQARASPAELHPRLVAYASRLYLSEGVAPSQFVVVLFGPTRLSGRFRSGGISIDYDPVHLFDLDPAAFHDESWLLPFAVLCRPTTSRVALVEDVAARVARIEDPEIRRIVANHAMTLANRHLDRPTLESIFRRLTTMPIDLSDLPIYREARAEGRAAGRTEVVFRLLARRFGEIGEERTERVRRAGRTGARPARRRPARPRHARPARPLARGRGELNLACVDRGR